MRPAANEYDSAYARYIEKVPEEDILEALETQSAETQRVLAGVDETRAGYRYAEGKWSVKEVIGHISDSERVFAYRALSFARGDTTPLPGFGEKEWNAHAGFDNWPIGSLAEQFALVRRANLLLLRNLPEEAWDRRGTANNRTITVRALAYAILGHERHHVGVLRDRYGLGS